MIEAVERPAKYTKAGGRSKYSEIYAALPSTLTSGAALRAAPLTRSEVNGIRQHFQSRNPGLRVVTRTLPDGTYVWLERRNGNGTQAADNVARVGGTKERPR